MHQALQSFTDRSRCDRPATGIISRQNVVPESDALLFLTCLQGVEDQESTGEGLLEQCSFVFEVSGRCTRSRKYRRGLVRTKLFCFWTVCKILTSLCWFKFLANEVLCDVTLPSARAHGHWTSSIVHRTRISLYITGLSYSLIKFTMYPIRMHDFNKKQFVDPKSLISNMPPYLACRRLSPITSSNFNLNYLKLTCQRI